MQHKTLFPLSFNKQYCIFKFSPSSQQERNKQQERRKMSSKGALPNSGNDPRRSNRIYRYKPSANKPGEDPTADYLNLMGMIFSMCGLMMRVSSVY